MKKFVAIFQEKKDVAANTNLLHAHIEYLKKITIDGKLLLCGPFQEAGKALFMIKTDTLEEAKSIIENDPFIEEGYYGSYELHEFIEANESNCWLIEGSDP